MNHRPDHSERPDRVVVQGDRLRRALRRGHGLGRGLHCFRRRPLVAPCDKEEERRSEDRQHADPEMQQEGDEEEEREPGHVEQGAGDGTADCLPDRLEVAHRLHGRVRVSRHHALEDLRREQRIEAHARPDQKPVPDRVQCRQGQQRNGQGQCHEQQCRLAARRNDAVVDLKHVDRRREEQQVDE